MRCHSEKFLIARKIYAKRIQLNAFSAVATTFAFTQLERLHFGAFAIQIPRNIYYKYQTTNISVIIDWNSIAQSKIPAPDFVNKYYLTKYNTYKICICIPGILKTADKLKKTKICCDILIKTFGILKCQMISKNTRIQNNFVYELLMNLIPS